MEQEVGRAIVKILNGVMLTTATSDVIGCPPVTGGLNGRCWFLAYIIRSVETNCDK